MSAERPAKLTRLKRHDDITSSFEALCQASQETDKESHANSTVKEYTTKYNEIVSWLCTKNLSAVLTADKVTINFTMLRAAHVKAFLETKKMTDLTGQIVADYAHNLTKYRSAINYFRAGKSDSVHLAYELEMKKYFKAVANREAKLKLAGRLPMKLGQKHMQKSIYNFFLRKAVTRPWCWVFCAFMWASFGRSVNIATTNLSHMGVFEDALTVQFPKSKGDTTGAREHVMHFYSNPYNYESCLFFALGIYFLQMKAFVGGRLFQGGKSKGKTFIDAMKRIIPEAYLVNWVGYGWSNLNNHAWRKGITSHITGGVEYPSPQVNIDFRAGHFPHDVKETYYHSGQPGDQRIGQDVSGKALGTQQMYTLCPYFKNPNSTIIQEMLPVVFEWYEPDKLPTGFDAVARRILASIVWHLSQGHFQKDHPSHDVLMESPLFDGNNLQRLLGELGDHCTVNTYVNCDKTGDDTATDLDEEIDEKPSLTGVGYRDRRMARIEENTSEQRLRKIVREESGNNSNNQALLERFNTFEDRVSQQMRQLQSQISTSYGHTVTPPVNNDMPTFKHNDGTEYLIPENFEFPKCTILPAFKSWFFTGDKISKVGPFKNLSANDIPTTNKVLKNARKRWSDWQYVMTYYAQILDTLYEGNWRMRFDYNARRIIIREVQKLGPLCKTGTIPTMLKVRTLAAKLRKLQKRNSNTNNN
jgi:hypothetical protein